MDLRILPTEVVRLIEHYLQPYRTYKLAEAEIITWHCEMVLYDLKEQYRYRTEVGQWSLYGQQWLARAHEHELIAERPAPPAYTETQDPQEWYKYRSQWLQAHA